MERLIDIVIFLAERNLAFRGSDEVLGSPHNGNFLGLLELPVKRDPVLIELKYRIIKHTTKRHYLSNITQNELIDIVAKKVEKELMTQLTKAEVGKLFSRRAALTIQEGQCLKSCNSCMQCKSLQ